MTGDPTDQPSRPSTAGMTTKVVKGSIWTIAGQVVPMAVSLIATPFVVGMLGSEGYGVLILILLIPNYFLFADLGMNLASTKFSAEAYAVGDLDSEGRIIRTAAFIAFCTSLPIAIGIFILSGSIISVFNVPEALRSDATVALKIASVTFLISFLNNIFNSPQLVRLRMDLNTFVNSGFRILGIVATPFVIYFGGGIDGAVLVLLIVSLLTFFGHLYVSHRLLPGLIAVTIDRNSIPSMLKFGGGFIGGGVVALLLSNLDKGILPKMVSVESLAYYSVAFILAGTLTMFASSMAQSLIPAFSQLQKSSDRHHLQRLYGRGIRLTLIWLIPALVGLSIAAKPFFRIWIGEDFARQSTPIFYVLLFGILLNIPAYIPYSAILASGRTDVFAKLCFIQLVPYVFLIVVLTYYFGAIGTAAAWSIRMIGDAILMFLMARKILEVSNIRSQIFTLACGAGLMSPPFILNIFSEELSWMVIALFVVCITVYQLFVWKVLLQEAEVTWVLTKVNYFVQRFNA